MDDKAGDLVTYQLEDSVATIVMDDGKVNVMSLQMTRALNEALDRAGADKAVVLLSGRPGVFSAGFDLSVLGLGGDDAREMVKAGFELAERVLSFPAPVVHAPATRWRWEPSYCCLGTCVSRPQANSKSEQTKSPSA